MMPMRRCHMVRKRWCHMVGTRYIASAQTVVFFPDKKHAWGGNVRGGRDVSRPYHACVLTPISPYSSQLTPNLLCIIIWR